MGKAVIFDWGGVIMRTHDRSGREAWDKKLGLPQGGVEQVIHGSEAWNEVQRGQRDEDSYWRIVAETLSLAVGDIPQLREDFYRGDRIDGEMIAFIRQLRSEGVQVGLMSNNSPDLHTVLDEHNLRDVFDAVVISADIGVMKPAPGAFQAVLDAMGLKAQDAIFVDDFAHNIDGAIALGMRGLHFEAGLDYQTIIREFLNDD